MIGSMGLASSIGLGLAIKNPEKRVYVFDGDGNILMNLGSLVTIGSIKPKNLVHFVFDNSSHESTGGQPTNSSHVKLEAIAKATNYSNVFRVNSQKSLEMLLKKIRGLKGPILILVEKRIDIEPTLIKTRFMNAINN
jgi:thiamine pyrophosphate-dependent acetolactate synthase large subunit-like protein